MTLPFSDRPVPGIDDIFPFESFREEKAARQSRDKLSNEAHDALDSGHPKYHKWSKLSLGNASLLGVFGQSEWS